MTVLFAVAVTITGLFVHVAFAIAVYQDAYELQREGPERLAFCWPFVWLLATLLGGVFVAAIYWALNRSNLRPQPPVRVAERPADVD